MLSPKDILDGQRTHWDKTFSQKPEMFGAAPSEPALKAAELFKREGNTNLLELSPGQGRDTFFFARDGFRVTALDYSQAAIEAVTEKAKALGLTSFITAIRPDVRESLPFNNNVFDCCYSHMLFCMAQTTPQLERLSDEVQRVLKPGGPHVYTVRHTRDTHYGIGDQCGHTITHLAPRTSDGFSILIPPSAGRS